MLIYFRLAPILPQLISNNQSGFVKGRNISKENMSGQEVIHSIKKSEKGNIVISKLDIAMAYDWVSWSEISLFLEEWDC